VEKFAQVAALRLPSGGFPLRSVPFPLLSVGLSGGVRRKSPYRFNRAGGKCRPLRVRKNRHKALPYRRKAFFGFFGGVCQKEHPAPSRLARTEKV